jgi:hypothetical protein
VIVGPEVLNGRKLLKREFTPILIKIKNRKITALPRAHGHREHSVSVGYVSAVIERLFSLGKVFTNLKGDRKHHIVNIKQHSALKRA